jgi:dynein heavy chain 1, cytosolic
MSPTQAAVASAAALLGADEASALAPVADGRALLLPPAASGGTSAIARVGSAYALLALPAGTAAASAARALLDAALLPLADSLAVAPPQREAARKALRAASATLDGLAAGSAVRVHPVTLLVDSSVAVVAAKLDRMVHVDDFDDSFGDEPAVLNALQAGVGRWNAEIDRVVSSARAGPGPVVSADEEQLFWASVDTAFESAQVALAEPQVVVTLQLLARKRRATGFMTDTTKVIEDARRHAQGVLNLIRGLPISALRAADDIPALIHAVKALLSHVSAKLRLSTFPLNRALDLVAALSTDVSASLAKMLLRNGGLLGQPFKSFRAASDLSTDLFISWNDGFNQCRGAARERAMARDEIIHAKKEPAFAPLQLRIREVVALRIDHNYLVSVVSDLHDLADKKGAGTHPGLAAIASSLNGAGEESLAALVASSADQSTMSKLVSAYDAISESCGGQALLDVSAEGDLLWNEAAGAYAASIAPIEAALAVSFEAGVERAYSLEDMASVAAPFATIINRAVFSHAITSHMTALTELARLDLLQIRTKSSLLLAKSMSSNNIPMRDIPPISAHVIALRQMSNAVNMVMAQVCQIVGRVRLRTDLDLRDLEHECHVLNQKLDPAPHVAGWINSLTLVSLDAIGSLFSVSAGRRKSLSLSLPPEFVKLPREIGMLNELGFLNMPEEMFEMARHMSAISPVYAALSEGIHAYKVGVSAVKRLGREDLESARRIGRLISETKQAVRSMLEQGARFHWRSPVAKLESFAVRLRDCSHGFAAVVLLAIERDVQITSSISSLDALSCRVDLDGVDVQDSDTVRKLLHRIRLALRDMAACGTMSSVAVYASRFVGPLVERAMLCLLSRTIASWVQAVQHGRLRLPCVTVDYYIDRLGLISVSPCLEEIEQKSFQSLSTLVTSICNQKQVVDVAAHHTGNEFVFGTSLFIKLVQNYASRDRMQAISVKQGAAGVIQCMLESAHCLVQNWSFFDGLWTIDSDKLLTHMGTDLKNLCSLLSAIRDTRNRISDLLSSHLPEKCAAQFGLAMDSAPLASRLLVRVDEICSVVTKQCIVVTEGEMRDVYSLASRTGVLIKDANSGNPMDVVLLLKSVEDNVLPQCESRAATLQKAEAILLDVSLQGGSSKNRIASTLLLSETWMDHATVSAVINSMKSAYLQRQRSMDLERAGLEAKYHALAVKLEGELADLFADAAKHRDDAAEASDPDLVVNELEYMEKRLAGLTLECSRMCLVSDALGLAKPSSENELDTLAAEIRDMRLAMTETSAVQAELDKFASTRLGDIDPKRVRNTLEIFQERLRDLEEARGTLALASKLETDIGRHLQVHNLVTSLRSAKLSLPREHEVLDKLLGGKVSDAGSGRKQARLIDARLGDIWACNLDEHERYLRLVFESAAAESSLASFLASVADAWTSRRVEFVHRGRVHLVRGIPSLVDDANEHLHALSTMSGSAHARLFESERASWELRISRFRDEVDIWADVQTKYLHLHSLFSEENPSAGALRRQLRQEFASFKSVQARFAEFTSRAQTAPGILEILEKASGLERMGTELAVVIRGLGNFLESQRSLFPRFFYLSDEDLLSVLSVSIGNLNDLTPHLPKIFPGVAYIQIFDGAVEAAHGQNDKHHSESMSLTSVTIRSVISKEGEIVSLANVVQISAQSHVSSWLLALETALKESLRQCLPKVVDELRRSIYASTASEFSDSPASRSHLHTLLCSSPAQMVLLAAKIAFTTATELAMGKGDASLELVRLQLDKLCCSVETALLLVTNIDSMSADLPYLPATFQRVREQFIKELVHQRSVLHALLDSGSVNLSDFGWYGELRFYTLDGVSGTQQSVEARMADASVPYGWEYLGVGDTLVETPLTRRCFVTLTQALKRGLGASPFGPAGTGKTESVKALGRMLGRAVAVFNCDESFDAVSIGRILAGVSRTGSWVCFDEFNRLSSGILSSTSNQLATLQAAIQNCARSIPNFYGGAEPINICPGVAVFVTMNPTYTGRRELPANLASLFRPFAMTKPDSVRIAEVCLLAQGFSTASSISSKLVCFFESLASLVPSRAHYDFGLRSLKSSIEAAGSLLTEAGGSMKQLEVSYVEGNCVVRALMESVKPKVVPEDATEFDALLTKLFPNADMSSAALPFSLLDALRMEAQCRHLDLDGGLLEKVGQLYKILEYRPGVMLIGPSGSWKTTTWQLLYAALKRSASSDSPIMHDGNGREKAITTRQYSVLVIDPKLVSSAQLYGSLDPTTREWMDGIFTRTLRAQQLVPCDEKSPNVPIDVNASTSANDGAVHTWIVFDGDVDPDWAENLNSVLDDSRVLTLPSGERIPLPRNTRILFESEDVKFANPSTVSRCGMVCFSSPESLLPAARQLESSLAAVDAFRARCTSKISKLVPLVAKLAQQIVSFGQSIMELSPLGALQAVFAVYDASLRRYLKHHIELAHDDEDIASTLSCASRARHADEFSIRSFLVAAANALGGGMARESQVRVSDALLAGVSAASGGIGSSDGSLLEPATDLPPECHLCDVTVTVESSRYVSFASMVTTPDVADLDPLCVGDPDVVVPTRTTEKHVSVLSELTQAANSHSMVLLCGPPGCGKSMIIADALMSLPDIELASMSFSSTTSPQDILATLRAHSSIQKLPSGEMCLRPRTPGSRIVLFCDEVNLGSPDVYGTQTGACFLRQLIEQQGFWCEEPPSWMRVEGLQIVAACNPPEDAGRQALPSRLLRHTHVMRVDAPDGEDLRTIFGVLNACMLRAVRFEDHSAALTTAMIGFYEANKNTFSPASSGPVQPHYVYSPRDMSRWLRGMRHILLDQEGRKCKDDGEDKSSMEISRRGISTFASISLESGQPTSTRACAWSDVLSSFVHEARRLFVDRLIFKHERTYSEDSLRRVLVDHLGFQTTDTSVPDQWYSAWHKRNRRKSSASLSAPIYQAVRDIEGLRKLIYRKLRSFCEEEGLGGAWMSGSGANELGNAMFDQFAVTDDVLKHLTRIERVLRLPLGHAVLIGAPGSGKKTLARFAAWMGSMSVHQVRSHSEYTAEHFADDLRNVLQLAGVSGDSVMMIFDESNALDGEFLEMMNAILACGDVPGLFEGENRVSLLSSLRKQNHLGLTSAASDEALYKKFISRVRSKLHVVFTLTCASGASGEKDSGVAAGAELLSRSPALYNRCVVNWMGDWDSSTLEAVADLKLEVSLGNEKSGIVKAAAKIHAAAGLALKADCVGAAGRVTPRHFLEFVEQLNRITIEKADDIQVGAARLKNGLDRLRSAGIKVDELKDELNKKATFLGVKEKQANATLVAMADEQRRAEKAKVDAEALAEAAACAADAARERQEEVSVQLAAVQPKVNAAREAVGSIRKENLEELRGMPKPPAGVKLALEGVMTMLDAVAGRPNTQLTWAVMRARMRGSDLISSVVNFDPESISADLVRQMEAGVLRNPDFDVERIAYSSRAAGPLAEWTLALIDFAAVNDSISPMREEIETLTREQFDLLDRKNDAEGSVLGLEARICQCRVEYAGLVSEAEFVRREILDAGKKLENAERMLDSLACEWDRWMEELNVYNTTADFVWGNAVLGAAFVSYAGALDEAGRKHLIETWKCILAHEGIAASSDISVAEFLSSIEERASWTRAGLAMDETSVQSYAILKRSARYPLVIDPSGRMETAIRAVVLSSRPGAETKSFAEKSVVGKTSFAATGKQSYLRVIESAMRFGTAVIVEDAEQFDHSIACVLGQEATTGDSSDTASIDSGVSTGSTQAGLSHRMVRLGDRDVDQSPSFRLFLAATDLSVVPASAVSRSCVVSFSFSEANLRTTCLSRALNVIMPELESRRSELTTARLAYEQRKLALESELLSAIANSGDNSGELIEGTLFDTLEKLKTESADINEKMRARERVTQDVTGVAELYGSVASTGVDLFFALDRMTSLSNIYRFSAEFFLTLFDTCVRKVCSRASKGDEDNISHAIREELFATVYLSVAPSLFPEHQLPFAAALAVVANEDGLSSRHAIERVLGGINDNSSVDESLIALLPSRIPQTTTDWNSAPTSSVVASLIQGRVGSPVMVSSLLDELASRLPGGGSDLVHCSASKSDHALKEEIMFYTKSSSPRRVRPLLLCARGSGVDPSHLVSVFSKELGAVCESVAVGDAESMVTTKSALAFAIEHWGHNSGKGGILVIKNMHLAPSECVELVRREIVKSHGKLPYLLIVASEVNHSGASLGGSSVVNLASDCRLLTFEAPFDFRATLARSVAVACGGELGVRQISADANRALVAVSWLHALLLDRCRYAPIGFSKKYEFSEADLTAARDLTMSLFVSGRNPSFSVLANLLAESVYGGRVETADDRTVLNTLVHNLVPRISGHASSAGTSANVVRLMGPVNEHDAVDLPFPGPDLLSAVNELPLAVPPSWIGLGQIAASDLQRRTAVTSVSLLAGMYFGNTGESWSPSAPAHSTSEPVSGFNVVEDLLCVAPLRDDYVKAIGSSSLFLLHAEGTSSSPLHRYLAAESHAVYKLCERVIGDLGSLVDVFERRRRTNERLQGVLDSLSSSSRTGVPLSWQPFLQQRNSGMSAVGLVLLLEKYVSARLLPTPASLAAMTIDMTTTLRPAGLICALRLTASSNENMPLECLEPYLTAAILTASVSPVLTGLATEGGLRWDSARNAFTLCDGSDADARISDLPPCALTWRMASSPKDSSYSGTFTRRISLWSASPTVGVRQVVGTVFIDIASDGNDNAETERRWNLSSAALCIAC